MTLIEREDALFSQHFNFLGATKMQKTQIRGEVNASGDSHRGLSSIGDSALIQSMSDALKEGSEAMETLIADRKSLRARADALEDALREAVMVIHRLEPHMPRYNGLECPASNMVPAAQHDYGWALMMARDKALQSANAALANGGKPSDR